MIGFILVFIVFSPVIAFTGWLCCMIGCDLVGDYRKLKLRFGV